MYNPFDPTSGYYYASDENGTHWVLAVQYNTEKVLYRSDMTTDLQEDGGSAGDVTIGDDGKVDLGGETP